MKNSQKNRAFEKEKNPLSPSLFLLLVQARFNYHVCPFVWIQVNTSEILEIPPAFYTLYTLLPLKNSVRTDILSD